MNFKHTKEFLLHELPDSMLDEVRRTIRLHSTTLIIQKSDNPADVTLASGTLCKISDQYGIVTARHVWDHKTSGISKCLEIKIPMRKGTYPISTKYLSAVLPATRFEAFGCEVPDIAFVRIPDIAVSHIEAFSKVFYSVDKSLAQLGDLRGYWSTYGGPAILLDSEKYIVPSLTYATSAPKKTDIEGWDFLELDITAQNDGMPSDVRGMSGGGIWRTLFSADDFDIRSVQFYGVNFYQSEFSKKYKIIGHGPKSIYSNLANEVN